MAYQDSREGCLELLASCVDARIARKVEDGLEDQSLFLIQDPHIDGVWAVVKATERYKYENPRVEAVLYLEAEDFTGFEGPEWH